MQHGTFNVEFAVPACVHKNNLSKRSVAVPNGFISVDFLKGVAGVARTRLSRGKKEKFWDGKIDAIMGRLEAGGCRASSCAITQNSRRSYWQTKSSSLTGSDSSALRGMRNSFQLPPKPRRFSMDSFEPCEKTDPPPACSKTRCRNMLGNAERRSILKE